MQFLSRFFQLKQEKGQAFLVVVLVMVIALTVGLSIASRSVINLKNASEDTNSQKAFSAAEAGIEQALQNGVNINKDFGSINGAKISQLGITQIGQNASSFLMNYGYPVPKDDGVDVWLTNYSSNSANLFTGTTWSGNMTVYWGSSNDVCDPSPTVNTQAALEVIVISGTKASPTLKRYAIDPCTARRGYSSFANSAAGGSASGKNFADSYQIMNVSQGLVARVTPLYASTQIAVVGTNNFPSQGQLISATGVVGSSQREVNYYQAYVSIPSEYFYSLFSPN